MTFVIISGIKKWLKCQGEQCPQCNAKAKEEDIRIIYPKSISAIDTTERDRALKVRGDSHTTCVLVHVY